MIGIQDTLKFDYNRLYIFHVSCKRYVNNNHALVHIRIFDCTLRGNEGRPQQEKPERH